MQKPPELIRLGALPAPDVWHARGTVAQYALAPRSIVTVKLAAAALRRGDAAGLAVFDRPYAWVGVLRGAEGFRVAQFDERTARTRSLPLATPRLWLRADCDFVERAVTFGFSTDGTRYTRIGEGYLLGNEALASQGIACALFSCRIDGGPKGGHADFDTFLVATRAG